MQKILREINQIVEARNKKAFRIREIIRTKPCCQLCFGRHSDAVWAIYFVSIVSLSTYYSFDASNLIGIALLALIASMIFAIATYSLFSNIYCQRMSNRIDEKLSNYELKIQDKILEFSKILEFKVELEGERCSWMQDLYIKSGSPEQGLEYLDNTETKCVMRYSTKDK